MLSIFLLIGVAVGLDLGGVIHFFHTSTDSQKNTTVSVNDVAALIFLLLLSYFSTWMAIFFNAGLASCAIRSMQGEDTTVKEGIREAWKHKGHISAWALVVCTVGLILRSLEERLGFLGAIVAGILGLAWGLITLFAVPVIVLEDLGPWQTLKRSAQIFKERWGESLTGRAAISVISTLVALAALLIGVPLIVFIAIKVNAVLAVVLGALLLGGLIAMGILMSALSQTFNVAMYAYSASGAQLGSFTEEDFQKAFKSKR